MISSLEVLRLSELSQRLQREGHDIEPQSEISDSVRVWPRPERIITVALEPDGTLYKRSRRRYFLCALDAELLLHRAGCSGRITGRWLDALGRFVPNAGIYQDFVAGPGSWTLDQLSHGDAIWVWPDAQPYGWGWGQGDLEQVQQFWKSPITLPSILAVFKDERGPKASLVHTQAEEFVDLLTACCLLTSWSCQNCFMADSKLREVYYVHHHDKVVASIPHTGLRRQTLQGLRFNPDLYTDVSGYRSTMDDEEEF
jgi:hypothetical protein